jgi:RNA polymerase sigma factor (TIGR02999 family)
MRRILINRARDKNREKRGGRRTRVELEFVECVDDAADDDLLAINEALEQLTGHHPACAELVKLRFFAGLGLAESAAALGLARRTADRYWAYARAWLYKNLNGDKSIDPGDE